MQYRTIFFGIALSLLAACATVEKESHHAYSGKATKHCEAKNVKKVKQPGVAWKVSFGNEVIEQKSALGVPVRLQHKSDIIAIQPNQISKNSQQVEFAIYKLESLKQQSIKKLTPVKRIKLEPKVSIEISDILKEKLTVDLLDIDFEMLLPVGDLSAGAEAHNCCVTCDNFTACGCAVSMSCGSCCSGPCC